MKKFLNIASFVVLACIGVIVIGFVGYNAALAVDSRMGHITREGSRSCVVSKVTMVLAQNELPKTQDMVLKCADGLWGTMWYASGFKQDAPYYQPVEVLDNVHPGDVFNCAQYRRVSWSGRQSIVYFTDCHPT